MFICAAWKKIVEGPLHDRRTLVYRCDRDEGHAGNHEDKVLYVSWPDSESEPEFRSRNELKEVTHSIVVSVPTPKVYDLAGGSSITVTVSKADDRIVIVVDRRDAVNLTEAIRNTHFKSFDDTEALHKLADLIDSELEA
jgi:hypothetical protein